MTDGGLSKTLIAVLVDPEDKQPLYYFSSESILYNPRRSIAYEVRNNIPVMLSNEARKLDEAENERLSGLLSHAVETGTGEHRS